MSTSLLATLRRAGEPNLGGAMVRLARLAADVHRFETAKQMMHDHAASAQTDDSAAEGLEPRAVVSLTTEGQRSDRTEVIR